jgi:hypothetical protein
MIKDRILEMLDAKLGLLLLLLSLGLAGWVTYANRPQALPTEITTHDPLPVYVELDGRALSSASNENYYAQGPGETFQLASLHIFVPEIIVKQFTPIELGIPTLTVMRPPQLLPDPGPSLMGADKLPRFGDEFAPPCSADNPTPDKNAGPGRTTASGTTPGTVGSTTTVK